MPKLHVQSRFGIIPNEILNNKNISLKAKGLFGYIQSKPDNWDFSSERIALDHLDGRDAIRSALIELEKLGYLTRKKIRLDDGSFDVEYWLSDISTGTENPARTGTDFPTPENPTPENPANIKERSNKKEIVKKNTFSDFELFWEIYPKKEAKKTAQKCFERLSIETQKKAIEAIRNHTQYWAMKYGDGEKFSKQYIPIASTWINNERWEDIFDTTPTIKTKTPEEMEKIQIEKEKAEKIRIAEEKERAEYERTVREDTERREKAIKVFKKLKPVEQDEIIEHTNRFLIKHENIKNFYPEQYALIKNAMIAANVQKLYPHFFK